MRRNGQDGFTLVELAIVLVIVGLLIGGILVGQSMMSAARINAQVAQIQQFDAGVMNFKTKYKYLPGDSPVFGSNGNGSIDDDAQSSCPGGRALFVEIYVRHFQFLGKRIP